MRNNKQKDLKTIARKPTKEAKASSLRPKNEFQENGSSESYITSDTKFIMDQILAFCRKSNQKDATRKNKIKIGDKLFANFYEKEKLVKSLQKMMRIILN